MALQILSDASLAILGRVKGWWSAYSPVNTYQNSNVVGIGKHMWLVHSRASTLSLGSPAVFRIPDFPQPAYML